MKDYVLKYVGKYGLATVLAAYLVHFLVTTVVQKLDENIALQRESMKVHVEMVDILEDIRDGNTKYTFTPPSPSVSTFRLVRPDAY